MDQEILGYWILWLGSLSVAGFLGFWFGARYGATGMLAFLDGHLRHIGHDLKALVEEARAKGFK